MRLNFVRVFAIFIFIFTLAACEDVDRVPIVTTISVESTNLNDSDELLLVGGSAVIETIPINPTVKPTVIPQIKNLECKDITIEASLLNDCLKSDVVQDYLLGLRLDLKTNKLIIDNDLMSDCGLRYLEKAYQIPENTLTIKNLIDSKFQNNSDSGSIFDEFGEYEQLEPNAKNNYDLLCSLFEMGRTTGLWDVIASYSWLTSSYDATIFSILSIINNIAYDGDLDIAFTLASFSWMEDGISQEESYFIINFSRLRQINNDLAGQAIYYDWLKQDITVSKYDLLYRLIQLTKTTNIDFVKTLTGMPFLIKQHDFHDILALNSMYVLADEFPTLYDDLLSQEWFIDGVDDLEASLIQVLGTNTDVINPEDIQHFITNHQIESYAIDMPLDHEVVLTFIQSGYSKKNIDVSLQVEQAIVTLENFMQVKLPKDEVVLLFANKDQVSDRINWIGLNFGNHMVILPTLAKGKDENTTVVHESAHYYWNSSNAPLWFREGAADFLATYVRNKLSLETFQERYSFGSGPTSLEAGLQKCNALGMKTVSKLIYQLGQDGHNVHKESSAYLCNYVLGEWLLTQLYETLGEGNFSAAMRELFEYQDLVTESQIYNTYLNHTDESNVSDFKEVYVEIYGEIPE